jgi:hypothetical protein
MQTPLALGAGRAEIHRFAADHLAVALPAIEGEQRAAVLAHGDVGVDREPALEHRIDIARHHADAVRIVAAQVGLDQVGGDLPRLALVRSGRGNDRAHGGGERVGTKGEGLGHVGGSGSGRRRSVTSAAHIAFCSPR